eukprot:SAG22_NODE_532_length_9401_cov_29.999892_7_plen_866_part_00
MVGVHVAIWVLQLGLPLFLKAVADARAKPASDREPLQVEVEAAKPKADRLAFAGYSNLALQFGWVAMFGAVWPLAAVVAAASVLLQVRLHAKSMCVLYQRPAPQGCRGIGPWRWVFVVLGLLAVASNCGLVFFTSNIFTECAACPTGAGDRVAATGTGTGSGSGVGVGDEDGDLLEAAGANARATMGTHIPTIFLAVEHLLLLLAGVGIALAKAPRVVKQQVAACAQDFNAVASRPRWDVVRLKMRQARSRVDHERAPLAPEGGAEFPQLANQVEMRQQYVTTETVSEHDLGFSYVLVFEEGEPQGGSSQQEGGGGTGGPGDPATAAEPDVEDAIITSGMIAMKTGANTPGGAGSRHGNRCCGGGGPESVAAEMQLHDPARPDDCECQRCRTLRQLDCLGLRLFKLRSTRWPGRLFVFVVADQELLETAAEATGLLVPLAVSGPAAAGEQPGTAAAGGSGGPGFTVHVPFARPMKRLYESGYGMGTTCEDCREPAAQVSKGSRLDVVFKRRWCAKCAARHDDATDLFQFSSGLRARVVRRLVELPKAEGGAGFDLGVAAAGRGSLEQYLLLHDQTTLAGFESSWCPFLPNPRQNIGSYHGYGGSGGSGCGRSGGLWVGLLGRQPLGDIAAYFGGEVALHAALLGHHLRWTLGGAVLGVGAAVLHLAAGGPDTFGLVLHALASCIWSAGVLASWARAETQCVEGWGLDAQRSAAAGRRPRPGFKAAVDKLGRSVTRLHLSTGELEPYFSPVTRGRRAAVSLGVVLLFGSGAAAALTFVLVHLQAKAGGGGGGGGSSAEQQLPAPEWVLDLAAVLALPLLNRLGAWCGEQRAACLPTLLCNHYHCAARVHAHASPCELLLQRWPATR